MSTPEKESVDYDSSKDENVYDTLSSPTSPGVDDSPSAVTPSSPLATDPVERQRQIDEWTQELEKVEGEITMLRQVLGSKVRRANELKRNLGITPFQEFKHDLQTGISHIKESPTYQKTNETLQDLNDKITHTAAYQKTSAAVKIASEKTTSALSTVGTVVTKKLGDIKNSSTFKSMEEKVATSYASVKSKVTGSKTTDDIDSAFQEAKEMEEQEEGASSASNSPTTPSPATEKVPL